MTSMFSIIDTAHAQSNEEVLGIKCSPEQLKTGTCERDINKTLNIKQFTTAESPTILAQDLILAATSGVGLVLVIALVVMGFRYIMGGLDESAASKLKGNMKKIVIGLLLVVCSYVLIRIIQYIAKGS